LNAADPGTSPDLPFKIGVGPMGRTPHIQAPLRGLFFHDEIQKHFPMRRATPQMRNFATHLMAYETGGNGYSGTKIPPAFHVCEKLHAHMATFMGNAGFRALLSRALALATVQVPWLRAVLVKADGTLEGLEEIQKQHSPDELLEGGTVLLAQLLGLLVAFIGERLTLRVVSEVWPGFSLNDLDFENGVKK
jgi:hypothetical protein